MTTYYVDATSGSDSAAGTSDSTPWKTISKVNGSSFSAGDSILFKRGETWREQLTVPSSGSSGNPITFSAYGSGNKPIISGAALLSPGGSWTQATIDYIDFQDFETGALSGSYWSGTGGTDDTTVFKNGAHSWYFESASGDKIRSKTGATDTTYAEFIAWFRLSSSSTASSGNKTRVIGWEGSSWNSTNGVHVWVDKSGTQYRLSIGRGAAVGTTYNISTDTWYLLRACITANSGSGTDHAELYIDGTKRSELTGMTLGSNIDSNFRFGISAYNPTVYKVNFDDVYVYTSDSTTTIDRWYATVTTETNVVTFNRVKGTLVSSASKVTSSNKWYYDSVADRLYVYSTSNPNTAFTSPGIEAGVRSTALYLDSKDYVSISNIDFMHGNGTSGTGNLVMLTSGSEGVVLDGCDVKFGTRWGIFFNSVNGSIKNGTIDGFEIQGVDVDSSDNVLIDNLVIQNCTNSAHGAYGLYVGAITPTVEDSVIQNCTFINNNTHICVDSAQDTIIQNNVIYSSGAVTFAGVLVLLSASNIVIRYNKIYDIAAQNGIEVNETAGSVDANIYYNIISGCGKGIYVHSGAQANIYNNTLSSNTNNIYVDEAGTAATIKNNICYEATTREIHIGSTVDGAITINYNCIYHASGGTFMHWKGTNYNWADWKTNSSQDANSLNIDPVFVSSSDLRLQGSSPCINSGTDVGLTTDYAGVAISGLPDIGAYEFSGQAITKRHGGIPHMRGDFQHARSRW